MLEQTKRISLRISSVLSKVEPDLYTGSGSATLDAVFKLTCVTVLCLLSYVFVAWLVSF